MCQGCFETFSPHPPFFFNLKKKGLFFSAEKSKLITKPKYGTAKGKAARRTAQLCFACHPGPVAFCRSWGGFHRCPPHPALPAALPALPDPPCSIAAAPVHICPCARSYLLRLKPALQHCESSLQFIIIFFFPFLPTPPALLSSTKCPEALQLFPAFFSLSVSPSGSPPMQIAEPRRWVGRKLGAALGPVSSLAFPNGGQEH